MTYQYIKPSDRQVAKMQIFRDKFENLHKEIEESAEVSPLPKEINLCLTKLQEASFWLNKSITRGESNISTL